MKKWSHEIKHSNHGHWALNLGPRNWVPPNWVWTYLGPKSQDCLERSPTCAAHLLQSLGIHMAPGLVVKIFSSCKLRREPGKFLIDDGEFCLHFLHAPLAGSQVVLNKWVKFAQLHILSLYFVFVLVESNVPHCKHILLELKTFDAFAHVATSFLDYHQWDDVA